MIDTHIHTEFSGDSDMKIQDALEYVRKSGIGMTITEHLDFKFPTGIDFTFNIDKYFNDYEKYKNNKFMLGVEMGMQEICLEENKDVATKYPFDYVIGSLHIAQGEDVYNPKFYEAKSKKEAFEKYLSSMVQCINKYTFIDSLGHIDYISRYATFNDKEIHYNEFSEYINEVLKKIVSNGKVIEINTRRINNKEAYVNMINIYKAYKQLGGKYVTIGSDAHNAMDIGKNFDLANDMCQECNLKSVYFRNRRIEFV